MSTANKDNLAYIGAKPGENRDSDAWFTPASVLERVRWALGGSTGVIDFDPFSSTVANDRPGGVNAAQYFTKADDAIVTPWPRCRSVFMNPPYGRGVIHAAILAFTTHLHNGYFQRGVILVNNATETIWFNEMRQSPHLVAVCMPFGRISFENFDGKRVSGNTRGQAIMFFDACDRKDAQVRARVAFEGIPDKKGKTRFEFMGYVDSVNLRVRGGV